MSRAPGLQVPADELVVGHRADAVGHDVREKMEVPVNPEMRAGFHALLRTVLKVIEIRVKSVRQEPVLFPAALRIVFRIEHGRSPEDQDALLAEIIPELAVGAEQLPFPAADVVMLERRNSEKSAVRVHPEVDIGPEAR